MKSNKPNGKGPKKGQVPKVRKDNKVDAYTRAPAAMSKTTVNRGAKMNFSQQRTDCPITVRHREYIGDVEAVNPTFELRTYTINAGLDTTFSWLYGIAANYEFYRFKKLQFEYETVVGTDHEGTVMLAVEYDVSDANPATKQILLAYHDAVRAATWNRAVFTCDSPNMGKKLLTRTGNIPANTDAKLYDLGKLLVATQGSPTGTLGELYVNYEVELYTPQPPLYHPFDDSFKVTGGGAVTKDAFMGTTPALQQTEVPFPVTALINTLTFDKVGEFLLDLNLSGTGITTTAPVLSGSFSAASVLDTIVNATATAGVQKIRAAISAPGQTLTISQALVATTIAASVLRAGSYSRYLV